MNNFKINIPWELSLNNLSFYGNLRISSKSHISDVLTWDSVIILNDVKATVYCYVNKKALNKKAIARHVYVIANVGNVDFARIKNYFDTNSDNPGNCQENKVDKKVCSWKIDGCPVVLATNKWTGTSIMVEMPDSIDR